MDKLNAMNEKILNNTKQKKQFSDTLIARLKNINEKIKSFAGQINQLKNTLNELQSKKDTNVGNIDEKNKQIAQLIERVKVLENEKQQMSKQFSDYQKQVSNEKNVLQKKIDDSEAKIRQLTEENQNLKNQTNSSTEQMKKQEETNQAKINELMNKINKNEKQIVDLQNELNQKKDELASQVKAINSRQNQEQTQVEQLKKEMVDLKNQNDNLIKRIIDATQAIEKTINNLEMLSNSAPNQQTEEDVKLLFSEIEKSIENISNIIQGNGTGTGTGTIARPPVSGTQEITIEQTGGPSQKVSYDYLLKELQRKSSQQSDVNNKYNNALIQIKQTTNSNEIEQILNRNNIALKNGVIMGGKKSK